MKVDNINQLFEQIQQTDNNQKISNFTQTNANFPKNPYTQEIYQAEWLYKKGHQKGFSETRWLTEDEIQTHNLQIKSDEKNNFFESDLYKNNEKLRNIKFYNVEQLDKTSFDKLPPEIKPEKQWQENLKVEQFIASQGVKVLHNSTSNPRYNAKSHTIHMPDKSQYKTAEAYYNDIFHEIGHSTSRELGRIPKTQEQAINFAKRDELVAETSAIKLCELTNVNSNKTYNLSYLKEFLSKFGDDKEVQKAELGTALTESDKVLALTKSKYLTAKKQHTTISSKILNQTLETSGKNLAEKSIIDQKIISQGMELGD
ncbi:zincin-like metallopeptidase domain-containing protein [Gilliamella sp. wkB72]|uniref:zincin-like metallopeptidase domain-containing protein n=1 Tax=Gilliamella sp. wkB72 TaxID=3120265 RepID=UPI0011466927|nr:zincin-like metallopeptidase domain-containing protein [Gilliamella apicola]